MSTGPVQIRAADGVLLEARWDVPADPAGAVVLCHPHPLMGGTMRVPLLRTVAAALVAAGQAVLRFNFRGVGASAGAWDDGRGEAHDLAAAVEAAHQAYAGLPQGLAGWSFGALMALRHQAAAGSDEALVAIAPPTRSASGLGLPDPASLRPASRLFIVGDRDRFSSAADLRRYAESTGAEISVLAGSDHFFFGREHRVGEAAAAHFASRH